jgi:inosose dehydratase
MTAAMAPELVLRSRALRQRLRTAPGPLAAAPVGTVPILWNNVDVEDLRLGTDAATILDEIARLGYDGCQLGLGFPEGRELRDVLAARELRLAEVYAALPMTADGPTEGAALDDALERLRLLVAGDGDVLCVALDGSPERSARAGRAEAEETPRLTPDGWRRLVDVVNGLARATAEAGRRFAFHPHAGTFVETPGEADLLLAATDPDLVPLCLDVGHWLVGGGDPVAALRRYGNRVTHVHLKDVDPTVLARLQSGELADFGAAVRARLFTELGSGVLDLDGCLAALAELDYRGWLMVEQDSSWGPPSEAAAIGRRVLARALRTIDRDTAG